MKSATLVAALSLGRSARPGSKLTGTCRSAPAPLPAMRAVAGSGGGTFDGPGEEGSQVVRRVRGAWLVVSKGDDENQRLMLPAHLHVDGQ
jgi:hypothetical protein